MTRVEAAVRELADALAAELRAELSRTSGPPELLSIDQAADRAGIGRSLLYQQLGAGRVRSVKLGRRRLIPADALAELAQVGTAELPGSTAQGGNGVTATTTPPRRR